MRVRDVVCRILVPVTLCVALLLALVALCLVRSPRTVVYVGDIEQNLSLLFSEEERWDARDSIVERRKATVQGLISILGKKDIDTADCGPLHQAIELLGELRAKEAVEPLCKLLMYIPEGYCPDEDISLEACHVAAFALTRIGYPAIEYMMFDGIRNSDEKERRDIAAWVIMEIEGKEQAAYRMERAIEEMEEWESKKVKERLEAAKSYIENYEPTSYEDPSEKK